MFGHYDWGRVSVGDWGSCEGSARGGTAHSHESQESGDLRAREEIILKISRITTQTYVGL